MDASSAFSAVGLGTAAGKDGVLPTGADSEPGAGMLPSISGVPAGLFGDGATSDGSNGDGDAELVLSWPTV